VSDNPWQPVHHEEAGDEPAPPETRPQRPKQSDKPSDKSSDKSAAAAFTVMLAVPPEFIEAISGLSLAITTLAHAIANSGGKNDGER
jgi:hypothetical protein